MLSQLRNLVRKSCIEYTKNTNKETTFHATFSDIKCGFFFVFLHENVYLSIYLGMVPCKVTNFQQGGLYK